MNEFYKCLKEQSEKYGIYLKEQNNKVNCKLYKDERGQIIKSANKVCYRQLEHAAVNRRVVRSSRTRGARKSILKKDAFLLCKKRAARDMHKAVNLTARRL